MKYVLHNVVLSIVIIFPVVVHAQNVRMNTNIENIENIRGLVQPRSRAVLSSEIPGRITEIRFKIGERFNKDDLLIRFDCSLYNADLASARAKLHAEEKRHENNQRLLELNAISDIEVELSKSEMEIAQAEATIKEIRADNCLINAPYAGRVIDIMVNEYESVASDQELISILDDKYLEIDLIVPSTWLMSINIGENFLFSVDETGKDYSAVITQIAATVDPVSQTVRLLGEFEGDAADVLSGMSGTAIFK